MDETFWETALMDKRAGQNWQLFKDISPRVQNLLILMYKKSGKAVSRPAWLSKDVLVRLQCEKKMHIQWNQGHISWGEYRDAVWICMDGIRKGKVQLGLNLVKDVKTNKGYCRYMGQKRKTKEKVSPHSS